MYLGNERVRKIDNPAKFIEFLESDHKNTKAATRKILSTISGKSLFLDEVACGQAFINSLDQQYKHLNIFNNLCIDNKITFVYNKFKDFIFIVNAMGCDDVNQSNFNNNFCELLIKNKDVIIDFVDKYSNLNTNVDLLTNKKYCELVDWRTGDTY